MQYKMAQKFFVTDNDWYATSYFLTDDSGKQFYEISSGGTISELDKDGRMHGISFKPGKENYKIVGHQVIKIYPKTVSVYNHGKLVITYHFSDFVELFYMPGKIGRLYAVEKNYTEDWTLDTLRKNEKNAVEAYNKAAEILRNIYDYDARYIKKPLRIILQKGGIINR